MTEFDRLILKTQAVKNAAKETVESLCFSCQFDFFKATNKAKNEAA